MYIILFTFLNNLECDYYGILWMRKMVPQRLVRVHKVINTGILVHLHFVLFMLYDMEWE